MSWKLKSSGWIGVLVLGWCANLAHAEALENVPIGNGGQYLDVQGVIGSGSNTSYLVIDFGQTGGPAYAWAYKWDTPTDPSLAPTGLTLVDAVQTAEAGETNGLEADTSQYTFQTGPTTYVTETFVNNFTYNGSSGDPSQYWQYYNGTYAGNEVSWESAAAGLDVTDLTNNSFDGWYNSFDPDAPSPAIPTAAPEPASLSLLGCGVLWLLRRKRA